MGGNAYKTDEMKAGPHALVMGLVLTLCACSPLSTIGPFDALSARMAELPKHAFQQQRRAAHAEFSQRIGNNFKVLGTRDFVLEDESSIAPASKMVRDLMHQVDSDEPVKQCASEYALMGDRSFRTKMFLKNGRCRYLMRGELLDLPTNGTTKILVTFYDVVAVNAQGR